MNPRPARIARWADARPHHAAVLHLGSGRVLTYEDLWARSCALADLLLDLDMTRAPVGVIVEDAATRAIAELGIELAGGVFAPLAPDLAADELVGMLRFIEARTIIGPVPAVIAAHVPACAAVLAIGFPPMESVSVTFHRPDAVRVSYAVAPQWTRFAGTSGTTARPRVAVHTIASLMVHDPEWGGIGPDDVMVSALAPAHDYLIRRILNVGGTYVAAHGRDPVALAESARDSAATIAVAIPWMIRQWAAQPALHPWLRGLRFVVCQGPIPLAAVETLYTATGCIVTNAYGTSETGAVTTPITSWVDGKMSSIGRPRAGFDLRLVADARDVDDDEPGELWVRGPGVMEGYLKDPEQTTAVMEDGWFKTGDVMTRDPEGYYRIVGRLKSMINVAGRKVYPEEVELVLLAHPAVAQAIVLPAADPIRGERVEAVVVREPGQQVTGPELRAYCRSRLTAFKIPRVVRFVPSLPTTRYGRVSRQQVPVEEMP